MKRLGSITTHWRAGLALFAALFATASLISVSAADSSSDKDAKPPKKTEKKTEKKKLTGAELYAIHCNRCHPERYPTEATPIQWKTLMTHMRVRANLPATQAKEIVKYLQEEAGN